MRVGTGTRITLRDVALRYLFLHVAVPIGVILWRALEKVDARVRRPRWAPASGRWAGTD